MAEKRRVNLGKNHGKMGKAPVKWLLDLENGVYSVHDLMKISKKSPSNIRSLMSKYAINVQYTVLQNGKSFANYQWDKKHFLEKFYGSKN
jgi:hypothetical protein